MTFFVLAVILFGCAKQEQVPTPAQQPRPEIQGGLQTGPETQSLATTEQAVADEMVTCSYDGMKMKKSEMQASMVYKGKTLYFCTKAEMEKFKKDPEGYLSGKVKPN